MAGMVSIRDVIHVMLKEHRWAWGVGRVPGWGGAGEWVPGWVAELGTWELGQGGAGCLGACCWLPGAALHHRLVHALTLLPCPGSARAPACREEVASLQEYIQGTF